MNSENIVLAGFWIGCKPSTELLELLLKPIFKSVDYLSSSGLHIKTCNDTFHVFVRWLWEFLIYLPRLWFLMQNNTTVGMVVPFCVHPGLRLPNNARIYLPHKYVNEHTMM